MRFKTAAILSLVLVAAILAVRTAAQQLALSYVQQGVKEIPSYLRLFFGIAAFFWSFGWLLIPLTVSILFTIAIITPQTNPRRG